MYWSVYFEINCDKTESISIRNQLYSHHCTLTAEPQIGGDDEDIDTNDNNEPSSENSTRLICYAKVFHRDDEEYFRMYVERITGQEIAFIHSDTWKEKIKKILHLTKYSAIIVFVVILSHELIVLFLGDHKEEFWSDLWTVFWVSVIGAISALTLDSVMIWRERNN